MSEYWYCNRCGYGPHNPQLHLACILCGAINNMSFSTESSDVRATDLLNPSKVRHREVNDPFDEAQNDFSDDYSNGSPVFSRSIPLYRDSELPVSIIITRRRLSFP